MDETPLAFALIAVLSIGCGADGSAQQSDPGADAGDASSPPDLGPPPDSDTTGDPSDATPLPDDAGAGSDVTTYSEPTIWRLPEEASSWEVFAAGDASSQFAPGSPVRAAFDIEHSNFAFVLTDSTIHKLQLDDDRHGEPGPSWADAMPIDEFDADLAEATVLAAHADPEHSPDDTIAVLGLDDGRPTFWRGNFAVDSESFQEVSAGEVGWTHDDAPAPDQVGFAWRDNRNSRGWFAGEPPCDITSIDSFDAYAAYVAGDQLHLHDRWYCTDYFRALPVVDPEEPGPPAEGMPEVDEVAAAFWHNYELYLVAQ